MRKFFFLFLLLTVSTSFPIVLSLAKSTTAPTVDTPLSPVDADNIIITGSTTPGAKVFATGGPYSIAPITADANGNFAVTVALAQENTNIFLIQAQESASELSEAVQIEIVEGKAAVESYEAANPGADHTAPAAAIFSNTTITATTSTYTLTGTGEAGAKVLNNLVAFTDISGHWAETAINALSEEGVVSGYGNGLFGPNDPVTRAQIVKIALKAFGHDTSSASLTPSFPDVPSTDWSSPYIEAANAIGIVSGYDENGTKTFKPSNNVTRGEALKIILLGAGFIDTASATTDGNFTDVDSVTNWYAPYAAFAKKAGLVSGYDDGTFHGDKSITRAEVCVIVGKVVDYMSTQE